MRKIDKRANMVDIQIIKKTIELLDEFSPLYYEESVSQTKNYLEYVRLAQRANKADEKTLIQPKIFPAFLEDVLGFSKIDYIPEQRNKHKQAPDFTPIDTALHPFIFETKGSNATIKDLEKEFEDKSKYYLLADPHAKYVIITNMQVLLVFSKDTSSKLEDYSFSFTTLYQSFKTEGIFNMKDSNVRKFLTFVDKFKKKDLTIEKKIESIANAEPYPPLFGSVAEERESLKLTNSIRLIVDILKDDIKNNRGKEYLLKRLENDTLRKEQIAREIYSLCQTIDSGFKVPESNNVKSEDLEKQLVSADTIIKNSIEVYFCRIAYFTMTRLLLIRVWEDARFIEHGYVTLFNGGFKKWYNAHNKKIAKVLEQAFNIAKDKYEWLFTDQNNYAWYVPTNSVLVDVLYELAKYNLSIVNRDVLGTVYEEYLDIQDKKNKGQYYTPHQIVGFIWDRVGYTSKKWGDETAFFNFEMGGKRVPKLIFDPATGSGSFLVEAIYRLRNYFQFLQDKHNLEDAKNAVIKGIHGCEISAFSYYLTEVNILIQLTPIIKKLIELNEMERDVGGKFTLHVIHQDSLSLHNKNQEFICKEVTEDYIEDKDHDILKLEGEKLRIFQFIKENRNFDYAVANPPYIGEDSHKELFRSTLEKYPYWSKYYQGKMDYLYFFIILALQKLKDGGKLGFITTSYWLTADGASKLREYILNNAKIIEIVDFNEIKLFEHAKGQHNIVFILQKSTQPKGNEKAEQKIKVVQIKKEPIGKNVSEKLSNLIKHVKDHIDEKYYVDEYIDVYYSAVKQGELSEKAWYILHSEKTRIILDKVKQHGTPLIKICDVNQGLISGCHKVSNEGIKLLNQDTINTYGIKIGDGIFILTKDEVNSLNLSNNEKTIIRPFFKNSDILRYYVNASCPEEYVVYTTKDTNIDDYPNIRNHLKVFEPILRKRMDTYSENYPWFKLHREREKDIFEDLKIVCPYRSPINTFGYTDKPFYGSTDMYFITQKKNRENELETGENETPASHNLLYILGILNSSLFRIWCHYQTKPKGNTRELFYTPLTEMPIRLIDFKNQKEKGQYDNLIEEVKKVLTKKEELSNYCKYFDSPIMQIEKDIDLPEVAVEKVIENLDHDEIRNLWTSSMVKPIQTTEDFVLKKVGDIAYNLEKENTGYEYTLILTGNANKNTIKIDGEKEALKYLKQILEKNFIGCSWKDIEKNLLLPNNIEILTNQIQIIISNIKKLINEISIAQDAIDDIVYELYSVKKQDVQEILNEINQVSL
ncbi:MAG: N-6 DNA methylase [bacterium]|nr:N-6 DNA methylase [bacterium]